MCYLRCLHVPSQLVRFHDEAIATYTQRSELYINVDRQRSKIPYKVQAPGRVTRQVGGDALNKYQSLLGWDGLIDRLLHWDGCLVTKLLG
jgi:hypothetical protein